MTTPLRMNREDNNLFYCERCNEFLPSDKFYLKRQEYLCHKHLKERNQLSKLGTHWQRALNSLRNKEYQDLNVFGFKENHIHCKEIMQLLTQEQERRLRSFTYWHRPKTPRQGNDIGQCHPHHKLAATWYITPSLYNMLYNSVI